MMLKQWGWVGLTAVLLLLAACGGTTEPENNSFDPETITLGKTVYEQNCAACHGAELEGQANWQQPNDDGTFRSPPHDETGHTWHHGDAYLLERIRSGTQNLDPQLQAQSNMPAYDTILTDAEMEAVLVYIKSSWSADIQQTQAERTAAESP